MPAWIKCEQMIAAGPVADQHQVQWRRLAVDAEEEAIIEWLIEWMGH